MGVYLTEMYIEMSRSAKHFVFHLLILNLNLKSIISIRPKKLILFSGTFVF